MIICVEGVNGVGKTTYAKKLAEHYGCKIYRPFQYDRTDLHWDRNNGDSKEYLESIKIPVNTHVEDMYAADVIAALGSDAILDRSVPSAIAYGRAFKQQDGWYLNRGVCVKILTLWCDLIARNDDFMYVYLVAPYDVVKTRRTNINKAQYRKLTAEFNTILNAIRLPKMVIRTNVCAVDAGIKRIIDKVDSLRA